MKALGALQVILTDKRTPQIIRDNALSALLKFAFFRAHQVDAPAIITAVLPAFPLQADTFEAREAHRLLINEFENSNPILFGESLANGPQLIRVFFSMLGEKISYVRAFELR